MGSKCHLRHDNKNYLVESTSFLILSLELYDSRRYWISSKSISRPTASFPCMLPMYLNSGIKSRVHADAAWAVIKKCKISKVYVVLRVIQIIL